MTHPAPGKSHREGLTLVALFDMFPDEAAATCFFEANVWPTGRCCGHCGALNTKEVPNAKPMPYFCNDCRSYFSVRTGTALSHSKVSLRKWAIAIYLELTSLKSVSSMKLHRDIGVSQPTAWFMLHRIREAWAAPGDDGPYSGPVEVDETYMGGKRKNMSNARRKALAGTGRGPVGKTAVIGIKDRESNRMSARVLERTDKGSLQSFVAKHTAPGATVYSDEAAAYEGTPVPARGRQALRCRVCSGDGAHQRHRVLLGHPQARPHGHLPQDQPEAPESLRPGVRRQAQRAGEEHA